MLWWFVVVCGDLLWFAVICGDLRLFFMVCGGLPFSLNLVIRSYPDG